MEVAGKAISPGHCRPAGTSPDGQPGRAGQNPPEVHPSKPLSRTTAFRFHANKSRDPKDYDDEYRTLILNADGTFTDYNEHLWDLKSGWVTEGVSCTVYGGTYTLAGTAVKLRYSKIVSKVNDVVTARETLAADEPLNEPVITSGTLSMDSNSLTVKQFQPQGGEAESQTLVVGPGARHGAGGKYC